jgi:ribose-phosphate pyrophosphokinase
LSLLFKTGSLKFRFPKVIMAYIFYICSTAKSRKSDLMKIKAPIKFFAGRAPHYLAEKITQSYGTELGKTSVLEFSDGEFQPVYEESVRGCIVFIVQSTFPPADNLMELLLMIDAAKRASAFQVVAVMPYLGMARQARKDKPRCSIGAKLVADLLTAAGADRVMTMDLHADQIPGLF